MDRIRDCTYGFDFSFSLYPFFVVHDYVGLVYSIRCLRGNRVIRLSHFAIT
jgi:hypothetical protein